MTAFEIFLFVLLVVIVVVVCVFMALGPPPEIVSPEFGIGGVQAVYYEWR